MKKKFNIRFLVQAAIIAAIYAVLTTVLAPISYGPMQLRVSEALTVLPYFTPAAIPGLFIGCVASNIISPYGIPDLVCGSLATLVAALLSYAFKKKPWLVPLPPVILNGVVIGAMLYYIYGVPPSLLIDMGWVALGELVVCYVIGLPLLKYFERHRKIFELDKTG